MIFMIFDGWVDEAPSCYDDLSIEISAFFPCLILRNKVSDRPFFLFLDEVIYDLTSGAKWNKFQCGKIFERTSFVRRENYTYFTIYTAWSEEKVFKCGHDYQIENLADAIFVEILDPN